MQKVAVVPGLSRRSIELAALALLRAMHPAAVQGKEPTKIEELFEFYVPEKYGIETGYADLSFLGPDVLGYTNAALKISKVDSTLSDSNNPPTIRRFRATVGHEAAHCLRHVTFLNSFKSPTYKQHSEGLYRKSRENIRPFEDPEWQAWEFSRSLLMPKHLITRYVEKGYSLRDLAESFDVNPAFVEVRLKTLKIKPPPL